MANLSLTVTDKPQRTHMISIKRMVEREKPSYQLHLFCLLPLLWLIIFAYGPMYGLLLAFKDYRISLGIVGSNWVGFKYFIKFFNYYNFWTLVRNTLTLTTYGTLVGFFASVLLAVMVNSVPNRNFAKIVQTVAYVPYFISFVVIVGIMKQMLSPTIGVVNRIINLVGVESISFFSIPNLFKHLYVLSGIWQTTGWGAIIYLAALANIEPELHEAAIVDGATRIQRIRFIDLPGIYPTMVIILILNAGRIMSLGFDKVFLMQNDLNMDAAEVISTFVYKIGLGSQTHNFSYATAIGMFNSMVNLVFILTVNKIAQRLGHGNEISLW